MSKDLETELGLSNEERKLLRGYLGANHIEAKAFVAGLVRHKLLQVADVPAQAVDWSFDEPEPNAALYSLQQRARPLGT